MAGRIVLALAFLAVVAAGAVGLALMQDDGSGDEREIAGEAALPVPDCDPVTERAARQAQNAFEERHLPRAGRRSWFSGLSTTTVALARDATEQLAALGRPVSEVPAGFDDDRSVLMVMFDPAHERPELPGCIRRTPVIYVGNGPAGFDEGGPL